MSITVEELRTFLDMRGSQYDQMAQYISKNSQKLDIHSPGFDALSTVHKVLLSRRDLCEYLRDIIDRGELPK